MATVKVTVCSTEGEVLESFTVTDEPRSTDREALLLTDAKNLEHLKRVGYTDRKIAELIEFARMEIADEIASGLNILRAREEKAGQ